MILNAVFALFSTPAPISTSKDTSEIHVHKRTLNFWCGTSDPLKIKIYLNVLHFESNFEITIRSMNSV